MKYVVVADGPEDTTVRVVEAPNPQRAVEQCRFSSSLYDDLRVYQLARKPQPVAAFEAKIASVWIDLDTWPTEPPADV